MTEMNCERARELLSDFLGRSLPDPDSAALSAHIGRCPSCAAEADGLRETMALLRELPPRNAPPELMEKVLAAVGRERPRRSLWRVLFLPVHVKIPLEAAAAAILFVLVFGLPGGSPRREPLPEPPTRLSDATPPPAAGEPAAAGARTPAVRAEAKRRAPEPSRARERGRASAEPPAPPAMAEATRAAGLERETRLVVPRIAAPPEGLPPAMFASTEGKRVEMPVGGPEEPLGKGVTPGPAAAPFVFAAPPSRIGRPLPYGREVILEIRGEDGAAVEERIAGAAVRLGGALRRETAAQGAQHPRRQAPPPVVRVDLPASRAEEFLRELQTIGEIPPGGFPGRVDIPAGPTPDTVAFSVLIRVR